MNSANCVVWVTGASQGLGAAIASAVPDPRAHVINVSRRPHPTAENFPCDLSSDADRDRLAAHFRATLARLRPTRAILVNNAVTHHGVGLVATQPVAIVRDQLAVNVVAPLTLSHALLEASAEIGSVSTDLVFISSINAVEPLPGFATYCATKAALEQWVRTVRTEPSASPGVRAVCVRPGSVDTPGLRAATQLQGALAPLAREVATSLTDGKSADSTQVADRIWSAVWNDWPLTPIIDLG